MVNIKDLHLYISLRVSFVCLLPSQYQGRWAIGGNVQYNSRDKMSWIGLKSFIKSFSEFYCSELEINLVKLYFAVDSIKIKILFSIISQWEGETATVQSSK